MSQPLVGLEFDVRALYGILRQILTEVRNNSPSPVRTVVTNNKLPHFPITTVSEFRKFNRALKKDKELQALFVSATVINFCVELTYLTLLRKEKSIELVETTSTNLSCALSTKCLPKRQHACSPTLAQSQESKKQENIALKLLPYAIQFEVSYIRCF